MLRAILNSGTSGWSFDPTTSRSSSGGGGGGGYVGYSSGLDRPVGVHCGGLFFFTDHGRKVWIYDGREVWPLGLAAADEWENYVPEAVVPAEMGRHLLAEIDPTSVVCDGTAKTVTVDVTEWMGYADQGDGETPNNGLWWVGGFPVEGYTTPSGMSVGGTGTMTFVFSDVSVHRTLHDRMQFHFPYSSFVKDFDGSGVKSLIEHQSATGVFTMRRLNWYTIADPYNHSEHWFDVIRPKDPTSFVGAYGNESPAQHWLRAPRQVGRLTGDYEYVATLVTKHGYESNRCTPFGVTVENGLVKVVLNWIDVGSFAVPLKTRPVVRHTSDYIRNVRLYRSYADRPGAWYHVADLPWTTKGSMEFTDLDLEGSPQTFARYVYYDHWQDTFLGEALHDWKLVPKCADCMAAQKGVLAVADRAGLYVSAVGDPQTFYTYLPFEGPVVGLATLPYFDYFVVFLSDRVYMVHILDYTIQLVSNGTGLAGKHALAVANDRIVFQSPSGQIHVFSGGRVAPLPGAERIDALVLGTTSERTLNRSSYSRSRMVHLRHEGKVLLICGEFGTGTDDVDAVCESNFILVIHLDRPSFASYRFPFNITAALAYQTQMGDSVLLCNEAGYVLTFTPGARGDVDDPIAFRIESAEIGALDRQIRARRVRAEVAADDEISLAVSGSYDREPFRPEGRLLHDGNRRGDERHVNTYGDVVATYQVRLDEESSSPFEIKRFSVVLQPKAERQRNYR